MIVVECCALFEPEIIPIAVIAIVIENRRLIEAKTVNNPTHDRCLSRTQAPGHADHD